MKTNMRCNLKSFNRNPFPEVSNIKNITSFHQVVFGLCVKDLNVLIINSTLGFRKFKRVNSFYRMASRFVSLK